MQKDRKITKKDISQNETLVIASEHTDKDR